MSWNMSIETYQQRLLYQQQQGLYRQRCMVDPLDKNEICVSGQTCLDFSSNDYLGLKKHPRILDALIQACQTHGFGSGASAFISGYSSLHAEVEVSFAQWLGVEAAVLFGSGYAANIGIIGALSQRDDTILSDKLCHASLLDGIVLSRANHIRYPHHGLAHLETLLKKHTPQLMVTESIFSMEGDIAPISQLAHLAKQYHCGLIIDDAHGIGVLGQTGKGVSEHFELNSDDYTCLVMPLGKAFNAMGAMVAGSKTVVETIVQFAKSYRYSTALPPAVGFAIQTTLAVIQQESWRQQRLEENILHFIACAEARGLTLHTADRTPIKSILVSGNEQVVSLQHWLFSKGFYVSAIRPPTVPKHKARLRISLNAQHTLEQISQLIDHLVSGLEKLLSNGQIDES